MIFTVSNFYSKMPVVLKIANYLRACYLLVNLLLNDAKRVWRNGYISIYPLHHTLLY